MRTIQKPTFEDSPHMPGETVASHPAYSQISASRVSGGTYLYGTEFHHQHYITVAIRKSQLHRGLSHDWHHAREELIEIAMSESQWATFVSSMNVGKGVPCTIQHVMGTPAPGLPPPEDLSEKFSNEMLKTLDSAVSDMDALLVDAANLGLSKAKLSDLERKIKNIRMQVTSNTPYVAKKFGEHMEDVVSQAKSEVNAYALQSGVGNSLGSNAAPVISLPGSTQITTEIEQT